MKVLRINLHIRSDVSPRLYEALSRLPPRPRAELLRRLAELGLHVQRGELAANGASITSPTGAIPGAPADRSGSEAVDDAFGADFAVLAKEFH